MTAVGHALHSVMVHPVKLSEVVPGPEGWSDVIEARQLSNHRVWSSLEMLSPQFFQRTEYVHQRLGHILVNPHNTENTTAIVASYVFSGHQSKDLGIVNRDETSAKSFVERLVLVAKRERESVVGDRSLIARDASYGLAGSRAHFLIGERGCGKTFLLNYLLSRWSDYFDAEKVVWIRVNLVDDFFEDPRAKSIDLAHWIDAQCTKVLMRYYDPQSRKYDPNRKRPPLSVGDVIDRDLEASSGSKSTRARDRRTFQTMKAVFYGTSLRDAPMKPSLVPAVLARRVVDEALRAGYAFVWVLDGLDRLEATAYHRRKFENLVAAANRLASQQDLGAALVIVLRTDSALRLANLRMGRSMSTFFRMSSDKYNVDAVDLTRIVDARWKYLNERVTQLATKNDWPVLDWTDHWGSFREFLWHEEYTGRHSGLLAALGENRRAQTQAIQARYLDYVRRSATRNYSMVESMMRAERRYPPRPYQYGPRAQGPDFGQESLHDNCLVANVFDYPCPSWSEDNAPEHPHRFGALLGIRVLQLLEGQERAIRDRISFDRLLRKELYDLCLVLFGYEAQLVGHCLEEYEQFQLIRIGDVDSLTEAREERLRLAITAKGRFLLERLLFDLDYLNMAAMRMRFRRSALEGNQPFVQAVSLDDDVTDAIVQPPWEVKIRWEVTKVSNAISVYRLVRAVNEAQQDRIEERIRQLSGGERSLVCVRKTIEGGDGVAGMFSFVAVMAAAIRQATETVGQALNLGSAPAVLEEVRAFAVRWGTHATVFG